MQILEDETFTTLVQQAPGRVLVKFGASWCAPCRQVDLALAQIHAEAGADAVAFYTVDIEKCPGATRASQVMSVPTVIVFDAGRPVHVVRGAKTRVQLSGELAPYLNAS